MSDKLARLAMVCSAAVLIALLVAKSSVGRRRSWRGEQETLVRMKRRMMRGGGMLVYHWWL